MPWFPPLYSAFSCILFGPVTFCILTAFSPQHCNTGIAPCTMINSVLKILGLTHSQAAAQVKSLQVGKCVSKADSSTGGLTSLAEVFKLQPRYSHFLFPCHSLVGTEQYRGWLYFWSMTNSDSYEKYRRGTPVAWVRTVQCWRAHTRAQTWVWIVGLISTPGSKISWLL